MEGRSWGALAPVTSPCKLRANYGQITDELRANYGRITEVLRMGFAVVVAAVLIEPGRFGRGSCFLHIPKNLVRNEFRRAAPPKRRGDGVESIFENEKHLKMKLSIMENHSGFCGCIVCLLKIPQLNSHTKSPE